MYVDSTCTGRHSCSYTDTCTYILLLHINRHTQRDTNSNPGAQFSECMHTALQALGHTHMHAHTDIHTETHTCAHRHNYLYMQAEKPADLQHIHRWPQTQMALTETPTQTCTHVHTCMPVVRLTHDMHLAPEIPVRQQAGYPWVWAQCPHPRWHCHKVISTTNRHQLP